MVRGASVAINTQRKHPFSEESDIISVFFRIFATNGKLYYMAIIKKLYLFILNTFLPLFLMTFFISLFVLLMQFVWKYVDELVGKGIEVGVLAELFFYAALTIVPMALPLSMLLASLMTFGNLGERLELLAIKAAGISLRQTMKPLIVAVVFIAIGAFFFQNNVLPKAQVKMYSLLFSVRQKSPELDIPEGVFYDQISGYNLLVKSKDRETGMLYNLMIYDFSDGFDNAMVMLADSGRLNFTDDKQYLFFTLYSGESFENLRSQRTNSKNIPYRRESFTQKEILIPFDANFNRMDEGVMQNQYIGQNINQLTQSIDSLTHRADSVSGRIAGELKKSYFNVESVNNRAMRQRPDEESDEVIDYTAYIDIDSILANASLQERETMLSRAHGRAASVKQEYEYKSVTTEQQQKLIRRHEIERHKKFTLSFACLIFFFIGAPLGAIIRKGGLGTPVVISVLLFIFYYIIDNAGYKSALNNRWEVWQGMWLSSGVLLALGIFLTYKAINDSAVFNKDAYMNFFRKIIGRAETRKVEYKEVLIDEAMPDEIITRVQSLDSLCSTIATTIGEGRQSFIAYWTRGYDRALIRRLHDEVEAFVERAQNCRSALLVTKLMDYPILRNLYLYSPCPNKQVGWAVMWLLPLTLPLYLVGLWEQKQLRRELGAVRHTNKEIADIAHRLAAEAPQHTDNN